MHSRSDFGSRLPLTVASSSESNVAFGVAGKKTVRMFVCVCECVFVCLWINKVHAAQGTEDQRDVQGQPGTRRTGQRLFLIKPFCDLGSASPRGPKAKGMRRARPKLYC